MIIIIIIIIYFSTIAQPTQADSVLKKGGKERLKRCSFYFRYSIYKYNLQIESFIYFKYCFVI